MEKVVFDLNDMTQGPAKLESFKDAVETLDISAYQGKDVQIKGCAPAWAHLMVAGKLFPVVKRLEFLLDNGQNGLPIEIFKK